MNSAKNTLYQTTFLDYLFLKQYYADKILPLSTDALSDRNKPLDMSTFTMSYTRRRTFISTNASASKCLTTVTAMRPWLVGVPFQDIAHVAHCE
jgi:hypothetical protein